MSTTNLPVDDRTSLSLRLSSLQYIVTGAFLLLAVALGVAARAFAVERYSWDDIARRLEEIYARALAGRRAA